MVTIDDWWVTNDKLSDWSLEVMMEYYQMIWSPLMTDGSPVMTDGVTIDDWWVTSDKLKDWSLEVMISDDGIATSGFINNTYEKAASVSMECTYLFQTHNLQQYTENMNMMK